MRQDDLIAKIQSFLYLLRRGRIEQIPAALAILLFGAASYLLHDFPRAAYVVYGACALAAIWLFLSLWKRAALPPPPPDAPVSSAVKGLLPFTAADGQLFSRLGRRTELQSLLALAQNDQIAISVVRGESGAGKTSLLQAGLAFTLGREHCVYWEAVAAKPADALLHALRSQFPNIDSLESLPGACQARCVLILDQFEQLRATEPDHAPVFSLIERVAKGPAPYRLSIVIGFRREYAPDWLDFEQSRDFRAEQLPINLLAPPTASDALVTLASEAGFALDEALVKNFISSIDRRQPPGVSPVDVAIGLLSLANFVQQRGKTHVGLTEYELAGGSEGLLLAFVQQKLEEIPQTVRAPLLKGLVLALVDPSNNQRVAAGEIASAIAYKAETAESALFPWLDRLTHPRVRLLEKTEPNRYRLPHERLVPVFRRLTGKTLAALDQLRLVFESEFVRWRETRNRRHLLRGEDLTNVLRNLDQFVQGETTGAKTEYLAACLRWRRVTRLGLAAAVIAVLASGYGLVRAWDRSIQEQKLRSWGLPSELFQAQHQIDGLNISRSSVNDLDWLRSERLRHLTLKFTGSSLTGLKQLNELTSLDLSVSEIVSLAGLEQLKGLSSLTLHYSYSQITSLAGLEKLQGLTSLTLVLNRSQITSLAGLEQLRGLTSLALDLSGSQITSLAGLEQLQGLTSLTLNNDQITSFAGLEKLKGLVSLTLYVSGSQIADLAGLERLKGLTSLTLNSVGFRMTDLAGIEKIKGLSSLTINNSHIMSFAGLEKLEGLTSLTLDNTLINSSAALEKLKGLSSLTISLSFSEVSLAGLEQLEGLTSLTLNLSHCKIAGLAEVSRPKRLTSSKLTIPMSDISNLPQSNLRSGITELWLVLDGTALGKIPTGYKIIGLQD